MSQPKMLLTRRWPAAIERALAADFEVTRNEADVPMREEDLADALKTYDVLMPTVSDKLPAHLFAQEGLRTRLIANYGVGYNHIACEAAAEKGIAVTNTPGVLTDCTADIAMTLLLMLARRTGEGERLLRAGQWQGWHPTELLSTKVTGKTLGIIGMGRIGQAMARRCHHGFGMNIIFHNRSLVPIEKARDLGARQVTSVEAVLAEADFVSLHCASTPETRHTINAETLAHMKSHAFLINTARGDIVDEEALIVALEAGQIAGAGLDVYEGEPQVPDALKRCEKTVLLPHLGSNSLETREAMGRMVLENVRAFLAGKPLPNRVV